MADSLPVSLDVVVNLSMAQTEIATDMTMMAILTPVEAITERVAYFSGYNSAMVGVTAGTPLDYALRAFFDQTPRPQTVCVAQYDSAETFLDEVELIRTAAISYGKPIYGWALDNTKRDLVGEDSTTIAFASWIQSQPFAVTCLCTNDADTYDTGDTANIAYLAKQAGMTKVGVVYHDDSQFFPDVSYLATALSVNYSQPDSTITLKFKDLVGIPSSILTETQVAGLESRNCNCFVPMGNSSRVVRTGVQSAEGWYTDQRVNFDNFINELQTNVFNVFLRTPKVPHTTQGQNMLVAACAEICDKYVQNGTFANRNVPQVGTDKFLTKPAYKITPAPVGAATTSDRAARIAPPIAITAYDSGAMHTVTVNVNVLQ